ncbi:MAG: hypothetical protein PF441_03505 [Desulfuromusa sp.]|jgi:hypothetical protein|nr:hypothetical protein [Desulfuromusa sp.]
MVKSLALVTLIFILTVNGSFAATFTGKVVRVLDGDTIEALINKVIKGVRSLFGFS